MRLRGLYAITPDSANGDELIARARAAIAARPAVLQYRNKRAGMAEREVQANALAESCAQHGVTFIVNDDPQLAQALAGAGVHLGREDPHIADVRARMPGRLIGVSCYADPACARSAVAAGADYVAFGSVFASATKPGAVRAPLEVFAAARPLGVPLCAIGGITLDNAPQLIAAGADLLAVISDLFDAPDIAARVHAYNRLFDSQPEFQPERASTS